MKPFGTGKKRVLVLGEAPGETEDKEGRPFIGKAGQFLREVMNELDLDLDKDALTTNALICRPPDNKIENDKMIGYCRANLLKTIHAFEPRVVLVLGGTALKSILPLFWKDKIMEVERWAGWKIPAGPYWICPTYHPSYLLRMKNQLLERRFAEHIKAAFSLDTVPQNDDQWEEVETLRTRVERLFDERKIEEALQQFDEKGGWVSFDYETNCLKPEYPKARLVSCAVSNGDRTVAFPVLSNTFKMLGRFLASRRTRKIAANAKFEDRFTRHFVTHGGAGVVNWGWDTMLATHCLDNRPGICSLKFQAFVQMGIATYNEHIDPYLENYKGLYNRIHEIEINDLLTYNGMDALLEIRLAMLQRKKMGYEA